MQNKFARKLERIMIEDDCQVKDYDNYDILYLGHLVYYSFTEQ